MFWDRLDLPRLLRIILKLWRLGSMNLIFWNLIVHVIIYQMIIAKQYKQGLPGTIDIS